MGSYDVSIEISEYYLASVAPPRRKSSGLYARNIALPYNQAKLLAIPYLNRRMDRSILSIGLLTGCCATI
jgi:hypothetical protein